MIISSVLRVNVWKNQTKSKICGKRPKIDFAHTLPIGRVQCPHKRCVVSLAEYRVLGEIYANQLTTLNLVNFGSN